MLNSLMCSCHVVYFVINLAIQTCATTMSHTLGNGVLICRNVYMDYMTCDVVYADDSVWFISPFHTVISDFVRHLFSFISPPPPVQPILSRLFTADMLYVAVICDDSIPSMIHTSCCVRNTKLCYGLQPCT